MVVATLRIIVGHEIVRELPVEGPVTIGRRRDNTVVLDDEAVSGHHGRIEPDGDGFRYVDLGSMNGSLVAAGPRLRKGQSVALDELTQVMVGKTVLEFRPVPRRSDARADATSTPSAGPGRDELPDTTTGGALGPGLWGHDDEGQGLIHTPAVQPPVPRRPKGASAERAVQAPSPGADLPGVPSRDALPSAAASPTADADAMHEQGRTEEAEAARDEPRPAPAPGAPPISEASLPAGPAPGHARVLVLLDGRVETLALPSARSVLGRAREADVVVSHRSVSELHAEFAHVDGHWTIRDLTSTNGTRMGVTRVQERRPLHAVTHLIVGAVDLLFVHDGREDGLARPRPEALVATLRSQGRLSRREAQSVLREQREQVCPVEEVLVRRGLVKPGAAIEAGLGAGAHESAKMRWPAWEWALVAALAGAVAWALV